MNSESGTKINQLLRKWPAGTVATLPWLTRMGIYQQLVHRYEKGAWLSRIGQGAYVRYGEKVDWKGALYALQEQLGLNVHVGGKTALQLQGYAHFLPLGEGAAVSLFGSPATRLPTWFRNQGWKPAIRYTATGLFSDEEPLGLTQHSAGAFSIRISTPERAMMEVLHLVPTEETYDEAKLLMEGLTTLRPALVHSLLEQCNSFKVKRLFLVLAEICGHRWMRRIRSSKLDLGKGKRTVSPGGRFYPEYAISVPEERSRGSSRRSRR